MPCVIALLVLSIMSIFSATHRKMAREAFDCVFRRITLRPCDTGFDVKVKAKVTGKLINKSPKLAKFIHQRFEILSWVFVIVFTVASLWSMKGMYNYWAYGSCNGLNSGGFCAFDPSGKNNAVSGVEGCVDTELAASGLSMASLDLTQYPKIMGAPNLEVVMMGCYNCDFTREAYPLILELNEKYAPTFSFIHFPTKEETKYLMDYDYCIYEQSPEAYWNFVDLMFKSPKEMVANEAEVHQLLDQLPIDGAEVTACTKSEETQRATDKLFDMAKLTGIYGTPTIFINGTPVVGPKPYRVYRRLLTGSIF